MHYKIRNIFIITTSVVISFVLLAFIASIFFFFFLNSEKNLKISFENSTSLSDLNIKIFNTTKVPGLAREIKNYLKIYEIQKVTIGNDSVTIDTSIVKTSRNWYRQAKLLCRIICIDSSRIVFAEQYDTSFVIGVLVGNDYKLLKPFRK